MARAAAHPAAGDDSPRQPGSHARSSSLRVRVTLRGLQVTSHPKNPPETVGAIYPWLQIRILHDNPATAVACDDAGDPIKRNGRRLRLIIPARERNIASRAAWRAFCRAWEAGTLELPIEPMHAWSRVGVFLGSLFIGVVGLALTGFIAVAAWQTWTWSPPFSTSQWLWFAWAAAAAVVIFLVTTWAIARTIWSGAATAPWRVSRMGNAGVELTSVQPRPVERRSWTELRTIESAAFGHALVFTDGARASVQPDPRVCYMLNSAWSQHFGGSSPLDTLGRRSFRRAGLLFAILGIVAIPPAAHGPFSGGGNVIAMLAGWLILAVMTASFPEIDRAMRQIMLRVLRQLGASNAQLRRAGQGSICGLTAPSLHRSHRI